MSSKIRQEIINIEIPKELSERSKIGVLKAKAEMKNTGRRRSYIIGPILAASLVLGIFGPKFFNENTPENPLISTIEYSHAFDVSDTRKLVGWADNVFIGKVIKQSGTKSIDGIPETQFKVEVSENIKGSLDETVIVNQQGGYSEDQLILVENDQLLQEGKQYLFVTKHLKEENWNTLVPVYGDIKINTEEERVKLIEKFRKAIKEEIPFK
ncbi:hypothetical protein [Bacillus sp. EB01]|uniref:hypothetical protein n=1 Tax=Bacillus sp. EB01 TaxID=1347086 RepID=UPI0006932328|nr:hypothetical protein [Bacillus sp. EB01]